jgi:L-alanine-DL-glutamate epimerase-like enolase superfamily enzyme
MALPRRDFLKAGLPALAATTLPAIAAARPGPASPLLERLRHLDTVAAAPVLDRRLLRDPVIIERIELLQRGEHTFVRIRAKGGLQAVVASNERDMTMLHLVARELLIPQLIGRDARDWEELLMELYRSRSNYKRQGLLFWVPVASLEFAVLELLGRASGRSVTELLGGRLNTPVAVYSAHDDRHRTAEESVERMASALARSGAGAAKFKVGGRMQREDQVPGRTERIIRLARERLGSQVTLYADANSSYDVSRAIEVGRLCEAHGIAIYEEPVPFDQFVETKAVADALTLPVAGGEQESSHHHFRWLIAERALDVVQPDLFYFGGLVRSLRVARMAESAGIECSTHISGTGLGFLYMLHFTACCGRPGPFQEWKHFAGEIPLEAPGSAVTPDRGRLVSPAGPGFGVTIDPAYLATAQTL